VNLQNPAEASRRELEELLLEKPHLKKYQDELDALIIKTAGGAQNHFLVYDILLRSNLKKIKADTEKIQDMFLSAVEQWLDQDHLNQTSALLHERNER
jgi:hypothetical protein